MLDIKWLVKYRTKLQSSTLRTCEATTQKDGEKTNENKTARDPFMPVKL
jgi:hypothetical protein